MHITPDHNGAPLAIGCGTGINACARGHAHGSGLMQCAGVCKHTTLVTCTALPVTPHQHLAASRGTRGCNDGTAAQLNVIPRQQHTATYFSQAAGADAAAVAHHTALHALQRAGREDHQAAFGLDHMAVVHQGFPVTCIDHHASQLVLGVELQGDGFTGGQCHRAFAGHHHAAVAHLGRQQRNIA